MPEKLAELAKLGLQAMYYHSHARFAFASRNGAAIDELHGHLLGVGLPESRLILANS
jgi:hypothetical protein